MRRRDVAAGTRSLHAVTATSSPVSRLKSHCYVPHLGGKAVTLLSEPTHRDHTKVSKQKSLFRTETTAAHGTVEL